MVGIFFRCCTMFALLMLCASSLAEAQTFEEWKKQQQDYQAHLKEFEALIARMPIRRVFMERMGQGGFSEAEQRNAEAQLRLCVDRMEARLSGADWLCGPALTIADLCTFPVLSRMDEIGLARLWSDRPGVARWLDRMRAHGQPVRL